MTQFWFAASTEEFTPSQMLEQARVADRSGFDGIGSSDHFVPWFPEGRGSSAWAFLPAAGQVVGGDGPLFTSVTPVLHHYHPAVIAQYFMGLEDLHPGRAVLGVGSAEAISEVPLGLDWPEPGEMLRRFEAGLEAISRLWDGETVTMDGGWFRLDEARLYTMAARRPRMIVSAFGPQAAAIAGRWGDGLWTLGDPESAPEVIDAYRSACAEHGREPGEIVLQAGFHLGEPEERVIAATRKWKTTQFPEYYRDDHHDLEAMAAEAERRMSDEEFAHEGFLISSDVDEHIRRLRELAAIDGTTVVCLQSIGDHDPLTSIRRYGDEVLPSLRGARA
ncbi:LLM class flavin-dependent oxidoreductase [Baekduia soli]|uniref:LLM class flavin-dependent oxidoreductase n=1 Tax=Baekduia soli TaxID=496014 RepID=A0A5B8U8W7_9ACTN|nr:LLM class flavin-dependent oxidoreductase [Baekduia soli]QEC49583.1 LLM class flavin-dependent oxidoreductase [Baekduia soli]